MTSPQGQNAGSPFRKPPPRPHASEQGPRTRQEQKAQQPESPAASAPRFAFIPRHGFIAVGVLLLVALLWYGISKGITCFYCCSSIVII